MKFKAVLAVALLLAMAFACVMPYDENDAANKVDIKLKDGTSYSVTKGDNLTLTFVYSAESNYNSTVKIYSSGESSKVLYEEKIRFDVGTDIEKEIKFAADASGSMVIQFSDGVHDNMSFNISYKTSIWDNWTTYVAIIVVIILIVALILYKSRTAPKQKNQLTFEQIEAQKQADKVAPKERKSAPVKSERQRYLESKKK